MLSDRGQRIRFQVKFFRIFFFSYYLQEFKIPGRIVLDVVHIQRTTRQCLECHHDRLITCGRLFQFVKRSAGFQQRKAMSGRIPEYFHHSLQK